MIFHPKIGEVKENRLKMIINLLELSISFSKNQEIK